MKDAYYFSHDANARNDQRLLAVRMKYGMKGYGIYFGIIEKLRESSGYELPNDCSTIAYDLQEPADIIEDIVKNYGLFEFRDQVFYSPSLKERMKDLDDKRAKRVQAGHIGGLASASKRQATVNDCSSSKVKYSKVNESSYKVLPSIPKKHFKNDTPKPLTDQDRVVIHEQLAALKEKL